MKNVLITGGAGYLGRAFLRYLAKEKPDVTCTIFSRDHGKHSYCQREFPQHRYIIGDIRDYDSVEMAVAGHDTVIHAAAFKYVPEAETNVVECHEINVMGSLNVAMAAQRMNVEKVIGLSTDKACQPINVYGITKLMMERIFQDFNRHSATQFNLVRYGNVVSSTGSAIPIFRRQARETGVIKITNPEMTRFWLSVEQAVVLIIMALRDDEGGTILIPRLPSLSMKDVAQAAASIEFNGDIGHIQYETIGKRFGEKMHEDLLSKIESHYVIDYGALGMGIKSCFSLMKLYPMNTDPVEHYKAKDHRGNGYRSDDPDSFLTIEEAIQLIQGAPA